MKNPGIAMAACLLFLGLMGCAPAVDLVSKAAPSGPEDELSRALQIVPTLYVNNVTGSNNNPGTQEKPFLTLKKGLEAAKALSINSSNINVAVHAAPGTYTNLTGESFPINVPANIWLIGDSANKGNGPVPTILKGAGQSPEFFSSNNVTVSLHESSRLVGFRITAGEWKTQGRPNFLVVSFAKGAGAIKAAVTKNILYGGYCGLLIDGGCGGIVTDNVIEGNSQGINFGNFFLGDSPSSEATKVEGNRVRYNEYGASITTDSGANPSALPPDLGDGPAESAGNNVFAWNSSYDLYVVNPSPSFVVSARYNSWSQISPKVGVISVGSSPVITQGAKQAANTPQVWF